MTSLLELLSKQRSSNRHTVDTLRSLLKLYFYFKIKSDSTATKRVGTPVIRGYNDITDVIQASASLESFHALLAARRRASHRCEDLLQEFYAHGFWLDSTGNLGTPLGTDEQRILPGADYPGISSVMTATEFRECIGQGSFRIVIPASIPLPGIACAVCARTWNIDNAHNCITTDSSQAETITDFAGKTLDKLKTSLARRSTDAYYSLLPDSPVARRSEDTLAPLGGDSILFSGDEVHINIRRFYHNECRRSQLAAETEREMLVLLTLAGYKAVSLRATRNCYGSESYRGPWFKVVVPGGTLIIGWRKRVIAIDWSATKRDLLHLFDNVPDTKGQGHIHAWRYEQAIDYLRRIREAFEATDSPE